MLLVVNFHYVRAGEDMSPGIVGVDPSAFRRQLQEIGRSFEFVSLQDVTRAFLEHGTLPEAACLVTFDDGLREQYENAWPLLRELGVPGLFFASPGLTLEAKVAAVHRIHLLRGVLSAESLVEGVLEELDSDHDARGAGVDGISVPPEQYKYDTEDVRRLKYFLNFVVPADALDRASLHLLEKHVGSEGEVSRRLYMNEPAWRELAKHGSLGSHAMTHFPLGQLSAARLVGELERSRSTLESFTGTSISSISYPYGGPTAVTLEVERAAAAAGYSVGFTMERALNRTLTRPLLLGRLDANDAPGGKRPLVTRIDGEIRVGVGAVDGRRVWFEE